VIWLVLWLLTPNGEIEVTTYKPYPTAEACDTARVAALKSEYTRAACVPETVE